MQDQNAPCFGLTPDQLRQLITLQRMKILDLEIRNRRKTLARLKSVWQAKRVFAQFDLLEEEPCLFCSK